MALANYTDLQASIGNWLNRTDLTATIPDFITLAEAEMRRDITARPQVQTQDVTIVDTLFPLPTGFDGLVSLNRLDDDRTPLTFTPPDMLDRYRSAYGTRYYISGEAFYFDAAPGDVRIRYRALFSPLAQCRKNWLLEKHPDAYLYGALMQASPYLEDDPREGVWQAKYDAAVRSINKQSIRQETSGPQRMQVSACP